MVEMLDIGEHEPWPREVLEAALEIATPMTRLAILTGYYTGVRIGDAVRLQHIWITGGFLEFKTEKNKALVALPVEPLCLQKSKSCRRFVRQSSTTDQIVPFQMQKLYEAASMH